MVETARLERSVDILRASFGTALRNADFADLRIVCSDGDLRLHRLVLAAASPLLRSAFHSCAEAETDAASGDLANVVILPDFDKRSVWRMAHYLYGSVDEPDEESLDSWRHELLQCLQIGAWQPMTSFADDVSKVSMTVTPMIKEEPLVHVETEMADDDFDDDDDVENFNFEDEDEVDDDDDDFEDSEDEKPTRRRTKRAAKPRKKAGKSRGKRSTRKKVGDEDDDTVVTRKRPRYDLSKVSGFIEIDGGWECMNCKCFVDQKFKTNNHLCLVSMVDNAQDDEDRKDSVLNNFCCGGCGSILQSKLELVNHLHACPLGRQNTFTCDKCDKVFYDEDSRKFHLMVHDGKFWCDACQRSFVKAENYVKHWTVTHSRVKSSHKCPHCDRSFDYKKNLLNHVKTHGNPPGFPCKICEKVFNCYSTLWYHLRKHNTPISALTCNKCNRSFKSFRGLRYHMNLHEGRADYLCHDCGKGFITRQKLHDHRRAVHTFEKPYICDQCGQAFIRSDKLIVHKRRAHTGEKPYQCDLCEWRGVDSSSLIHHRKRHGNAKNKAATQAAAPSRKREELPVPTPSASAASSSVASLTAPITNAASVPLAPVESLLRKAEPPNLDPRTYALSDAHHQMLELQQNANAIPSILAKYGNITQQLLHQQHQPNTSQ